MRVIGLTGMKKAAIFRDVVLMASEKYETPDRIKEVSRVMKVIHVEKISKRRNSGRT